MMRYSTIYHVHADQVQLCHAISVFLCKRRNLPGQVVRVHPISHLLKPFSVLFVMVRKR